MIDEIKRALSENPANPHLYHLLGDNLKAEGKVNEALTAYLMCLCLNPNDGVALSNLGSVYKNLGNYEMAEKTLLKTLSINPKQKIALYNLGIVYEQMWHFKKAYEYFNKAILLDQNYAEPVRNKYLVSRQLCDFSLSKSTIPDLERLSADDPFISIIRDENLEKNLKVAKSWSNQISVNIPQNKFEYKLKNENKKIHIGYISNDFREHPIGIMTAPSFKYHNKNKFIISAYSYGIDDKSIYRQMVKDSVTNFVDLHEMGVYESAKKINKDGVDILIDLTGYTENHRLEIMAFRPAPIQMTWLGFPSTTGANFIDYLIADKIIIPKKDEKYFSEKIVRLPHCYQINDINYPETNVTYSRKDLGLSVKDFIFASFNQGYKIDSEIWQTWMNILKRVPNSKLILWQQAPEASKNLINEAIKLGVKKERLIFWDSVPKNMHLARIANVDLGLDTLTYGGHTTTTDCLRMQVPVITKIGKHFASRVCASILTEVGLENLIVKNLKDYENLAVDLAGNPKKILKLKQKLTREKLTKNLFNIKRFVRNLEKIYENCLS